MDEPRPNDANAPHRVGRPRRGTESQRADDLILAATRVFLRDGYGAASIDKVAAEAGVSTRTIYERFKNKADLLGAAISRLVERDMRSVFSTCELDRLEPREALATIGTLISGRACDPDSGALFRILATEAQRFPDLARKMRTAGKARVDDAIAGYFRGQVQRGTMHMADPDKAAALFMQMVCSDIHECLLFGESDELASLDFQAHVTLVIEIFLNGVAPRLPPAADVA